MTEYDVAIVGAGMAGASLAAELAPGLSVVILETEGQPGYHATGRSAALWHETYGGPHIQPLTKASLDDNGWSLSGTRSPKPTSRSSGSTERSLLPNAKACVLNGLWGYRSAAART
jgi:flavin-dependent dehydrogenase